MTIAARDKQRVAARDKQRVLDRLFKLRIRGLNIGVLRAIFGFLNPEHGVAWAKYCRYAEKSGRSERIVQRTIKTACDMLILRRAYREGAPAIWCPDLMDMDPAEAVRRVDIAVGSYNGKTATPTSSATPTPPSVDPHDATAASTAESVSATAAGTADQSDFFASKTTPETASETASKATTKTTPLNPKKVNSIKNEIGNPSCPVTPPRGGAARRTTTLPPASTQAHDLAVKIGKLCGLGDRTYEWSEHWRREAPHIVQSWLTDQGWYEDYVISVVRDVIERASDWSPPKSIRYFEPPITRFYAGLAKQIAQVQRSRAWLNQE